ncbi:hypothetical protein BDQ17DRAFT_420948 [Cyathus striatus]|nr:hypothetical protein BDQ17DRAFT_420948 [Cyathus striatus]
MSIALRGLSRSHTMLSSYTRALPSSFSRPPLHRIQITQLAALSSTPRKHKDHEQPCPGTLRRRRTPLRRYFQYYMIASSIFLVIALVITIELENSASVFLSQSLKRYFAFFFSLQTMQPKYNTPAEIYDFFKIVHEILNVFMEKKIPATDPTWEQLQKNWARTGKVIMNSLVDMDSKQAMALSEEEVDALESKMRAKVIIMRESERLIAGVYSLKKEEGDVRTRRAKEILTGYLSKMVEVTNVDIGEEEVPTSESVI